MENTNFSIEDIIVLEAEDVMEQDALLKIKGGVSCNSDCICGSGNSNSSSNCTCGSGNSNNNTLDDCTCGSGNSNSRYCLGFA